MPPFAMQKAAYCVVKGYLLQPKRQALEKQTPPNLPEREGFVKRKATLFDF